ncbi:MAG: acyltransferase family protein [Fusobacterium sp.]|uniref:acyltransferase family protein n=1 Tax=Fusobacterium sp. TaxID=68766 RepID=UPI003999D3F1
MKVEKRNIGLDALKFICAFLVVCIHMNLQGEIEKYFITLTRISVPIFFMITGFFYKNMITKGKIQNYILKIFKLCLISNMFYFIFNLIIIAITKGNILKYICESLGFKAIIRFIIFSDTPIEGHLWYLNALICTLIFITFINKHFKEKYLYMIIPFLLMCDLMLGKYSLFLWQKQFNLIFVRNWLFVGVPYFLIGIYIEKYYKSKTIKMHYLFIFILIFVITSFLERYFLIIKNLSSFREHYLSTTLLAIVVFFLFIERKEKYINFISKMGKSYSLIIYIIHPAIITLLEVFLHNKLEIHSFIMAVVVFFISLGISILYNILKKILYDNYSKI